LTSTGTSNKFLIDVLNNLHLRNWWS